MNYILSKAIVFICILVLLISITACDNGEVTMEEYNEDPNTGSLSFSLVWPDEYEDNSRSVGCLFQRIRTIVIGVFDSENSLLAVDEFPCNDHAGTLSDIPQGANRSAAIIAYNGDNVPIMGGFEHNITIQAGSTNDAGEIYMGGISYIASNAFPYTRSGAWPYTR